MKYIDEYNAKAYDRLPTRVPKGKKQDIEKRAKELDLSVNAYVNKLIEDDIK